MKKGWAGRLVVTLMPIFAFLNLLKASHLAGGENWGGAIYYMLWGFMFTGMSIIVVLLRVRDEK